MKRKMTVVDVCGMIGAVVFMIAVGAGCVVFGSAAWHWFFNIIFH